jgi:hypothetical protein
MFALAQMKYNLWHWVAFHSVSVPFRHAIFRGIIAMERCCFAQPFKDVHSVSDRCFLSPLWKAIRYSVYRGYYTAARRYDFYLRVVKTIFYERAQRVSKTSFLTRKIKVISSSRRVMFCLLYSPKQKVV